MEAGGALSTPVLLLVLCSILQVFYGVLKATAKQIKRKPKQTLKSLRIEIATSGCQRRASCHLNYAALKNLIPERSILVLRTVCEGVILVHLLESSSK